MKNSFRGQYTLEFKQEAVRLVRGGEGVSSVAKSLGISGQTLHNWVKADAAGRLRDVAGKTISAEQMEIARLDTSIANIERTRRQLVEGKLCPCLPAMKCGAAPSGHSKWRLRLPEEKIRRTQHRPARQRHISANPNPIVSSHAYF